MKNNAIKFGMLAAGGGLFFLAVTSMFGTTVSSKFNTAQSAVSSDVTFGGPSVAYRAQPARQWQPAPTHVPAQPAPAKTNPLVDATTDRLSTFALDVDTASYTYTRAAIEAGGHPSPQDVRVEEFVNYFEYDRKPTRAGTPFSVHMESSPSPQHFAQQRQVLRVQVDARQVARENRKPAHLTFLIDTSGSMAAPNKLPLAKDALIYLTQQLDHRDTIAVATYAGSSELVLPPTPASKRDRIVSALENLQAGGGTAMGDGMKLAYDAAIRSYGRDHINRVIVVSDGDANIGRKTHDDILDSIRGYVDDGIQMTTVGVGMGNYRNEMMEQLANKGDGNAFYLDDMREARRIFGKELTGTLEVVAKEAKIQVEFDPALVKSYRLIGYENRAIADHDFRNDSVDAGEIGAGHQVSALYEVELHEPVQKPYAIAHLRWMEPNEHVAREGHYTMKRADMVDSIRKASADHKFATATALFAQTFREANLREANWELLRNLAEAGVTSDRPERNELVNLIRRISNAG